MTAEENYKAFESLRDRFGGGAGSAQNPAVLQLRRESSGSKRRSGSRTDPRSNAPPLVPLVEEEDQLQEVLQRNRDNMSLVKGKWKHSNNIKSNHLNAPDFDALETSSVTSCSSAYSSKSESSAMSPPCGGSVTELLSSDAGSCDTFQEYEISDHRRNKQRPQLMKIKGQSLDEDNLGRFTDSSPDCDVPNWFVKDHTKLWNDAIGEWKFEGKRCLPPRPSSASTYRVTNEVRVPTPLSTPLGSTDNLLESESRSSLFSSGDEASSPCNWVPDRAYRLGRFTQNRSLSTSNLISVFQAVNGRSEEGNVHMRSFSGTDLITDPEERVELAVKQRLSFEKTPSTTEGETKNTRKELETVEKHEQDVAVEKHEQDVIALEGRESEKNECITIVIGGGGEEAKETEGGEKDMVMSIADDKGSGEGSGEGSEELRPLQTNKQDNASDDLKEILHRPAKPPSYANGNTIKIAERIKLLGTNSQLTAEEGSTSSSRKPSSSLASATTKKSPIWLEAHNKSKALKTVQESQHLEIDSSSSSDDGTGSVQTVGADSSVKQRAQLFGGTKKIVNQRHILYSRADNTAKKDS